MKNFRHGDMILCQIEKLPEGLKGTAKKKVLHTGSSENNHSFDNGMFYPKKDGEFILGYFVAKKTTLFHPEHGKKIKGKRLRESQIEDGIYEVRRQNEITHVGMRPVED
mgnify:CR=1 FL=1